MRFAGQAKPRLPALVAEPLGGQDRQGSRGSTRIAKDLILANAAYVVDGRETVAAALAQYRNGKADFSDCLIVARNAAAGCTGTASLDKAMRPLPGVIAP